MLNYRDKDKFSCKLSVALNFVSIITEMNYDVGAKEPIIRAFAHVSHMSL
jgi:hypothetical protein